MKTKRARWFILFTVLLLFGLSGCATKLTKPDPPKGKGWFAQAQGYQLFVATSSSDGNNNSSSQSSLGYVNASVKGLISPEDVDTELLVGRDVREFKFNEKIISDYKLR